MHSQFNYADTAECIFKLRNYCTTGYQTHDNLLAFNILKYYYY